MSHFWLNEIIKILVFFSSTFTLGKYLVANGVKVNYTRKIFHFIFFYFPIYLAAVLPYEATLITTLTSGCVLLLCLSLMWEPVRERSSFLCIAYSAIDRPEDRPFTLIWISTQLVATYLILMIMIYWLAQYQHASLIYITVLVAGIGDGLAEPVGIRFGKHHYRVRALFTEKIYFRTLEGSSCVFVSGILALALLSEQLNSTELILGMAIIPATMTLAEALSPHTWDGPFLYLAGGTSTVAVLELSRLINVV